MNHRTAFAATLVTVLAMILPVQAQSGKIQVSQSRDASGNAVITIHETRPEVLARQRQQIAMAQEARAARKRQKQELELARAQAEARAQLQANSAPQNGWAGLESFPPSSITTTTKSHHIATAACQHSTLAASNRTSAATAMTAEPTTTATQHRSAHPLHAIPGRNAADLTGAILERRARLCARFSLFRCSHRETLESLGEPVSFEQKG